MSTQSTTPTKNTTDVTIVGQDTDSRTCTLRETTDLQFNDNLAKLTKLIQEAIKSGAILAGNSARLQGLTVDDIIKQVEAQIDLPTVDNYITQDNINQMDIITKSYHVHDTKFVQSEFIKFKLIEKNIDNVMTPYITFLLPYDLKNKDKIVQIHLTNTNSTADTNKITNEVLFEYDIYIDPIDPAVRYRVDVLATKLILGETITYNVQNLPAEPYKWGTFGLERSIRVTYLVADDWYATSDPNNIVPNLGDASVSVQTDSVIMPMIFGSNSDSTVAPVFNENLLFDKQSTKIINEMSSDLRPSKNHKSFKDGAKSIYTLGNTEVSIKLGELLDSYVTSSRIINAQDPRPEEEQIIKTILDNFSELNVDHLNPSITDLNEVSRIMVFPPNKIITLLESPVNDEQTFDDTTRLINSPTRIINELISNVIEARVLSYLDIGIDPIFDESDTITSFMIKLSNTGLQYPVINIHRMNLPSYVIEQIIYDIVTHPPLETTNVNIYDKIKKYTHIIDFVEAQEAIIRFSKKLPTQSAVIDFVIANIAIFRERSKYDTTGTNIINFIEEYTIMFRDTNNSNDFIKEATPIIQQFNKDGKATVPGLDKFGIEYPNDIDKVLFRERNVYDKEATPIINFFESSEIDYFQSNVVIGNKIVPINNEATFRGSSIINQIGLIPATVVVSSGSLTYLQDVRNLQIVSSLNKIEFVPILTAEGRMQGSTYEIYAEADQRVFEVETSGEVVIYREGFRLSSGDFYITPSRVILKSPARLGELIVIEEKKKYVYSNNVTKQELNNKLKEMRAETPIISYINTAYELQTIKIKIDNFQAHNVYTYVVKYDGITREDIPIIRNGNVIYVDLPEVLKENRKNISIIIYNSTEGKIQSSPAEANIAIRNLYDTEVGVKRLVFGIVPTEWYGTLTKSLTFEANKDVSSNYELILEETDALPQRLLMRKDNAYVSNIIHYPTEFTGSTLDTKVTLENTMNNSPRVISTGLNETLINLNGYTQEDLEAAHLDGSLYFVLDGDETPLGAYDNQALLVANFGKYHYRRSIELSNNLNFLPRDSESVFLEHTYALKNRYLRNILIYNAELIVDHDFDTFAEVIDGDISPKVIPIENIEYQVQDGVPHLKISIVDPTIPNPNNPYINLTSNFTFNVDSKMVNDKINAIVHPTDSYSNNGRRIDNSGFMVNNIYGERIFSGVLTDHQESGQDILDKFKKIIKFQLGNDFITPFKKDTFFINEEELDLPDTNGLKYTYVGLSRFRKPQEVHDDIVTFKSNIKIIYKALSVNRSFKALINTNPMLFDVGSDYVSNMSLVQVGGDKVYTDGNNVKHTVIGSDINFERIYIKDNFNIDSGIVPDSVLNITDGYHTLFKVRQTLTIPNYWDVVFRPSLRTTKNSEIMSVWYLIRDNIDMEDQRWKKLNSGLIRKGQVIPDTNNPGDYNKCDHLVQNVEGVSGFFMIGGETYKTIKTQTEANTITQETLGQMAVSSPTHTPDPDIVWLQRVYSLRGIAPQAARYDRDGNITQPAIEGYKNLDVVISINYGWDNGEPCVWYRWARIRHVQVGSGSNSYWIDRLVLYTHKVSRIIVTNTDIYYLNANFINAYTTNTLAQLPATTLSGESNILQCIEQADVEKLFANHNFDSLPTIAYNGQDRVNFQDICYESNKFWIITRNAENNNSKLWSLTFGINGSHIMTSPALEFHKEISTPTKTKWSLLKEISKELRGDGPVLIRHNNKDTYIAADTLPHDQSYNGPGFYFWDNMFNTVEKKMILNIPCTCTMFEIEGNQFMNPYYLLLDGYVASNSHSSGQIINKRMDIIGNRIFIISYLDRLIQSMTQEQFNLFKEEIVHLNNKVLSTNPDKLLKVLPNHKYLEVKTIVPDPDYKSSTATVIYNRIVTETGRPAVALTYRLKNYGKQPIEVSSVRFSTSL